MVTIVGKFGHYNHFLGMEVHIRTRGPTDEAPDRARDLEWIRLGS